MPSRAPISWWLAVLLSLPWLLSAQGPSEADRERFERCRALQAEGRWSEARTLAEELVRENEDGPVSRYRIAFTNELANLDQRLGNYGEAADGYRSCLELASELDGPRSLLVSQLQNNLAALLQITGDFAESERLQREALASREAIEGTDNVATVAPMNNLAGLLWCIGDLEGAETLYRRALAIRERDLGPDSLDTARSQANLGGLFFYEDELDSAAPLVRGALEVFRREAGEAHPETLDVMLFLGEIERAAGSPEKARELYDQVVTGRLDVFGEEHVETAEALRRLGDAERELGEYEGSLNQYRRSDEIYRAVLAPTHPDRIEGLYGAGLAALATGDAKAALEAAREASEVEFANLAAVLRFTDERQRLAYRNLFRSHHLFADLARDQGEVGEDAAAEVAEFLLRGKGVVFDSLIAEARMMRRADSLGAGDASERLAAARARFRAAFLGGEESGIDPSAAEEALRVARRDLLERIGLGEEESDPISLELDDLVSALAEDEVLVDFLVYEHYLGEASFESRYGAAIVTAEGASFADCGLVGEVDWLIGELHRLVRIPPDEVPEEALRPVLRSLHEELVEPVLPALSGKSRLHLCPDRALHFVPFACLVDGEGSFLVEGIDVGYVSASRELIPERSELEGEASVLLVGNPDFAAGADGGSGAESRGGFQRLFEDGRLADFHLAPLAGAEVEVSFLADLFGNEGSDTTLLVGPQATEDEIRTVADRHRVLHFATHGIYLPPYAPRPEETRRDSSFVPEEVVGYQNPLFGSWLALAGANQTVKEWSDGRAPDPASDGVLMANEAAELDLEGTLLVTLSACDTATGEATEGDGVLGIRRGFRMAGAEHVLTTLWPINDAVTVRIMRDFYAGLGESHPEGSLSATQRRWLVSIRDGTDTDLPVQGLAWSVQLAGPFLLGR